MERHYEIPEGDGLKRLIRNPREEAIYDVLGGINAAAEALKVRRQSVHYLLTQPRIRDTDTARRLSEATARAGRLIPVAEILDLEPWQGPLRHGTDPKGKQGRKGPNGSRLRPVPNGSGAVGGKAGAAAEARAQGSRGGRRDHAPLTPRPLSGIWLASSPHLPVKQAVGWN